MINVRWERVENQGYEVQKGVTPMQDSPSRNRVELELKRIEAQLNAMSEIFEQQYQFTVDKEANQLVMKVVDVTSGKVLRQIPSEEMLKLAAQMNRMIGIFMDHLV
jgi:flagellar protein FlaG